MSSTKPWMLSAPLYPGSRGVMVGIMPRHMIICKSIWRWGSLTGLSILHGGTRVERNLGSCLEMALNNRHPLVQRLGLDKRLDQLHVVHVAGTKGKVGCKAFSMSKNTSGFPGRMTLWRDRVMIPACISRVPHAPWWRAYCGAVATTPGYSHRRISGMSEKGYSWTGETKIPASGPQAPVCCTWHQHCAKSYLWQLRVVARAGARAHRV